MRVNVVLRTLADEEKEEVSLAMSWRGIYSLWFRTGGTLGVNLGHRVGAWSERGQRNKVTDVFESRIQGFKSTGGYILCFLRAEHAKCVGSRSGQMHEAHLQ